MSAPISYKQLPSMMAAGRVGVKFAAARTLNDIAFKGARKIPQDAQRDLNFRSNAKNALGFRVDRARAGRSTKLGDIEARVWTPRGWVFYHVQEGKRRARQGWRFNGRRYLLVPYTENKQMFFTVKGRLRARFRRAVYVLPRNDGAVVLFRKKGAKDALLVGYLKDEVNYHKDLNYDETMDALFKREVTQTFQKHLNSEIRRNARRLLK